MEALILAAGRGSRLGELTGGLPKTLVQIGCKPIIGHQLALLHEIGVRQATVVVGYKAEEAMPAIRRVTPPGMSVKFARNPFYSVTGTLGSFWMGLSHLSDDIVFMNGDCIFDRPVLQRLVSVDADLAMCIDDHPCADEEMKVIIENGYIIKVSKEVDPSITQGEFIGLATFRKPALRRFSEAALVALEQSGPLSYFEAALEAMAASGDRLTPVDITGLYWQEIDFPSDLERARAGYPTSEIGREDFSA